MYIQAPSSYASNIEPVTRKPLPGRRTQLPPSSWPPSHRIHAHSQTVTTTPPALHGAEKKKIIQRSSNVHPSFIHRLEGTSHGPTVPRITEYLNPRILAPPNPFNLIAHSPIRPFAHCLHSLVDPDEGVVCELDPVIYLHPGRESLDMAASAAMSAQCQRQPPTPKESLSSIRDHP